MNRSNSHTLLNLDEILCKCSGGVADGRGVEELSGPEAHPQLRFFFFFFAAFIHLMVALCLYNLPAHNVSYHAGG